METETVIENLLKAKGFNEVIAIMHKNNINIIVEKQELTTEELAQILEIVKRESQFDTNNIVIFPRK
jgi:stage III sporulation protein AH